MTDKLTPKSVATHFFKETNKKPTSNMFARTMSDIKKLNDKYELQDIYDAISYIIEVKKVDMYSFGYVVVSIDNIYKEMIALKYIEKAKEVKEQMKNYIPEVKTNDSTKNNSNKSERFGVQCRFGEKLDFDLFEKPR